MRSSVHIGTEFAVLNENLLSESRQPIMETVTVEQIFRDYVVVTNGRYRFAMCWIDLFGEKDSDDK